MAPAKKKTCTHQALCLDASDHGRGTIGFQRVPAEKRIAAATTAGRPSPTASGSGPDAPTFPGPLVLPDDELALNPKYPPQSLRSWMRGGYRNPITPERRTLYVAGPPALGEDVGFMTEWSVPEVDCWVHPDDVPKLTHPDTEDVIAYLAAFYHPLPVKRLPTPLRFVTWDEKKQGMVGLAAAGSDVAVGIRTRPSPDGIAKGQLNLGDVLDALAGAMPRDAFAAVALCEQDLYEDEEDEFCCGRAFGGSRISVVSSFRYRPVLDVVYGIEGAHCWPAAHCARYVGRVCEEAEEEEEDGKGAEKGKGKKRKRGGRIAADGEVVLDVKKRPGTAMGAAVAAARGVLGPRTGEAEEGMWFARVARTAAHELGHCFGMDHCVYYACSMQGSAGLVEDGRQPPYLCPVCEGKFVYGVGEMGVVPGCKFGKWEEGREEELRRERMRAMKGFCERWEGVGMFAGFGAWLGARMKHEGNS